MECFVFFSKPFKQLNQYISGMLRSKLNAECPVPMKAVFALEMVIEIKSQKRPKKP